jgi:hypothetical protein
LSFAKAPDSVPFPSYPNALPLSAGFTTNFPAQKDFQDQEFEKRSFRTLKQRYVNT